MYSYNKVNIIGYQTQPITVRQTPGGTSVTDLNIAVPYNFKSDTGDNVTGKGFFTVTAWGGMADIAGQYLKPGAQVFISGRLQTDSWEDEQSGEKRSKTKIVAMDLIMLDPKDGQLPQPQGAEMVTGALNRADIVGNLTRDPEVRTTTNGKQVVSLGIATNDRWRDRQSGEDRERAEFHNVVVWETLGEQIGKFGKKGSRIHVAGRVQTRTWETQSGQKRYTTEIVADSCTLLGMENPAIKDNIDSSGSAPAAPRERAAQAPSAASEAKAQPAGAPIVPEVKYESEVKVEDLPF